MSQLEPEGAFQNSLPFPCNRAADGTITTQWIVGMDESMLNTTLEGHCVRFGLKPASKNKKGYLDVLRAYSQNQSQWRPIGESAKVNVRRHKAAWPVSNSPTKKASKKRQEVLLLGADVTGAPLPTSHVLRVSTNIAGEKLLTWATRFLANKSAVQPTTVSSSQKNISNTDLMRLVAEFLGAVAPAGLVNVDLGRLEEVLPTVGSTSHSILEEVQPVTELEGAPTLVSNTRSCILKGTKPISLVLHGKTVVFQPTEIPVPPKISLGVEDLIAMWDDQSSLWKNTSPLKIRGLNIPIKQWQQIYGVGRCTELWTGGLKQKWHKWKYLASAYYSGEPLMGHLLGKGPENGHIANITELNNRLREARKNRVNMVAAEARAEFGQDFDHKFRYQKNHRSMVCSKPDAIARRYLKGMGFFPY